MRTIWIGFTVLVSDGDRGIDTLEPVAPVSDVSVSPLGDLSYWQSIF
jgi:hypothetical protein